MSVRAYPIKKIEYEGEIFNLWHDEYFVDLLDRKGLTDQLNIDGCGIISICKEDLNDIEQEIENDIKGSPDLDPEDVKRAKEIIKEIKNLMAKRNEDCIDFYCF